MLIGRACPVCRIWFDRVRANHYSIKPDTAYTTGTTNQKTVNVTRKWHHCLHLDLDNLASCNRTWVHVIQHSRLRASCSLFPLYPPERGEIWAVSPLVLPPISLLSPAAPQSPHHTCPSRRRRCIMQSNCMRACPGRCHNRRRSNSHRRSV